MEDEYDVKKSRSLNHGKRRYRIRKSVMRIKKKAIFFLLTRMMRLIPIHIEINPTVRVIFGSIFQILWI